MKICIGLFKIPRNDRATNMYVFYFALPFVLNLAHYILLELVIKHDSLKYLIEHGKVQEVTPGFTK